MKNIITTTILTALGILMAGCASDQKKIERAAYGYLDAMGNYRIEDAYDYATEETQSKTLDIIQQYIMPTTDMDYIKRNSPATITITGIEMTDDTSVIVSYHKTTPIQEQDGTLDMRKRNNKWKAQVLINLPNIIENSEKGKIKLPERDTMHLQVLKKH